MTQTQKTVKVLARVEFKSDSRKICYQVLSSHGADVYTTCLFDGKATGCSCPATNGKCYHRTQVEQIERIRSAPSAKSATFTELKRVYDVRQNPSTRATDLVLEAKRRQAAPLAGASRAFSLMR